MGKSPPSLHANAPFLLGVCLAVLGTPVLTADRANGIELRGVEYERVFPDGGGHGPGASLADLCRHGPPSPLLRPSESPS